MNLKEFEELIDSIDLDNREEEKYTLKEIYDIGCAFIEMSQGEKRAFGGWTKLAEILQAQNAKGEIHNGESLRCWIKNERYKNDEVVRNEKLISGKTIDDITFAEFENQVEDIKRGLYKQQVKTRDAANSYRRALREDARVEYMNDLIKESVAKLKDLPAIEDSIDESVFNDNVEAVMLFSDLHVGMELDNFYNKYNVEIARRRVQRYVNRTIELCQHNNVRKLNVLNLGDLIHGNIHVSARIENNEDLISQIMTASEIMAEALNQLQAAAPEVIYRSCSDNHSRVTPDFRQNIEKENYFRLIDFYLEARLKDTNIQIVHDNLDVDLGMFELLNGKKMMFAHGHRENINTIIQGMLGATRQYIDYVCVGHYHESKMKSFQGAKVFVNSSICGSDSYAQSKRLYGNAEQTLLIFKDDVESVNYINLDIK